MRYSYAVIALILATSSAVYAEPKQNVPTKVAPLYSLPPDGTWVELDFKSQNRRGTDVKGVLRLSSVGQKQTADGPVRWIEVKMSGADIVTRYGKMLVREKAFTEGQSLEDNVLEAYHQENIRGPIKRMTGSEINDYFTMGIRGELKQIKEKEEVTTKFGSLTCRYVEGNGRGRLRPARLAQTEKAIERSLEYRAWLTNQIPFGIARFEVWAKVGTDSAWLAFAAEAARRGTGAKSEVDLGEFQRNNRR